MRNFFFYPASANGLPLVCSIFFTQSHLQGANYCRQNKIFQFAFQLFRSKIIFAFKWFIQGGLEGIFISGCQDYLERENKNWRRLKWGSRWNPSQVTAEPKLKNSSWKYFVIDHHGTPKTTSNSPCHWSSVSSCEVQCSLKAQGRSWAPNPKSLRISKPSALGILPISTIPSFPWWFKESTVGRAPSQINLHQALREFQGGSSPSPPLFGFSITFYTSVPWPGCIFRHFLLPESPEVTQVPF